MPRPINNKKAGETDRACIKSSLYVCRMVKIGSHALTDVALCERIIDKIPGAQFHKIIMAIKADLDKEKA